MQAPEELRTLAKNGLREIAVRGLKARGPRMDAVFYLLDAIRRFSGKSLDEVREVAFDIGMLGQYGLDINDPQETHVLRSLPRRTLSVLDHYSPTFYFLRTNSQKLDPVFSFSFQRAEINNHNAVLIVLDYLCKGCNKLNFSLGCEIAAEDRVMNWVSKALHDFMNLMQSFWVHYIIADYIAFQTTHKITNPSIVILILCRKADIRISHRI